MNPTVEQVADAVETVESGGRWWVVSKSGCIGLMQICPQWSKVPRDQLLIPEINRQEGIRMIRYWKEKAHGDWWLALAGYRCGWQGLKSRCGHTYARKVMHLVKKQIKHDKEGT